MHVLESTIAKVTVYGRGALVERRGKLPPGATDFQITALPRSLEDHTLRLHASGEDPPGILIHRVLLAPATTTATRKSDGDGIEARYRAALAHVERLKGDLQAMRSELQKIQRLKLLPRPQSVAEHGRPVAPEPTPHRERLDLLLYVSDAAKRLHKGIDNGQETLRLANEIVSTLAEQRRQASVSDRTEPHQLCKSLVAEVTGQRAGPMDIALSYFVLAARWEPSYRLRLSTDLQSFTLEMQASVAQRTGEDWSAVELDLSSAQAQRWCQLPTMHALRIGRAQDQATIAEIPAPPGLEELFADHDRAFGVQSQPETPLRDRAPEEQRKVDDGLRQAALAGLDPGQQGEGAVAEELGDDTAIVAASSVELSGGENMTAPMSAPEPLRQMSAIGPPEEATTRRGRAPGSMAVDKPRPQAMRRVPQKLAQPDFSLLRMPAAQHRERGGLVLIGRDASYTEYISDPAIQESVRAAQTEVGRNILAIDTLDPSRTGRVDIRESCASNGHAHIYSADSLVSIASDGAYATIHVTSGRGECRARYVCVPSHSPRVFRSLRFPNPLSGPLLAGPVDTYAGEAFLLGTSLGTTASGGEVEIGLGVEQRVKVVRNTHFEEVAAGLIGNRRALKHRIAIDIDNRLPFAVALAVRERLPQIHPEEDSVALEIDKLDPPWQEFKPQDYALDGGKEWCLTIGPGEVKKLNVGYTISIPTKMELVGGNRRQ